MMIRGGGSAFAKYCRRWMSSSRELPSENQKKVYRGFASYVFKGGLFYASYAMTKVYRRHEQAYEHASLQESLIKRERDLEVQMAILEYKESLLKMTSQDKTE
ncbi:hypothetical protein ISN44_As04g038340 [Arabidopsis suecica]|uniref:Uncharacterized protein n=1 Tax=Arabidopsis suecica TaxID=45249 RepID=A0A8T2EIB4_ARASU|nr:hypothetical protein ISN44_As04g038340 [Arabidopsis suecica]